MIFENKILVASIKCFYDNLTVATRTGVSSWKHLIDVPLNFTFGYEKESLRGVCAQNRCKNTRTGTVSKETVARRRWEIAKQELGLSIEALVI